MGRADESSRTPRRQRFVVERYAPGVSVATARDGERRLRRAASASTAGARVRYVGSIVIPAEETVMTIFEADLARDLEALHEAAGVGYDRIVPIVELRASEWPTPVRSVSKGDIG